MPETRPRLSPAERIPEARDPMSIFFQFLEACQLGDDRGRIEAQERLRDLGYWVTRYDPTPRKSKGGLDV